MKIIFYLLPCVMNIIMGLFFFITMRRLAISGADSFAISGTMAVWAFIYAIVSALLGAVQNKKNATKFILAGEGILILSMAGFLIFPSMDMQYVWLFGSGIGTAMFFAPFQVIVKMLDSNETAQETLPKTAAVYTFAQHERLRGSLPGTGKARRYRIAQPMLRQLRPVQEHGRPWRAVQGIGKSHRRITFYFAGI